MKVLLVENNKEYANNIRKSLENDVGPDEKSYEVTIETNYKKALKLVNNNYYDLVITDMRIGKNEKVPSEEGLGILRALANKTAIAIVITAYVRDDPTICVKSMRARAWDCIQKKSIDEDLKHLANSIYEAYEDRRKHPERGIRNPDSEWILKNFDKIIKKYPGEFIAVLFEKVIDHCDNYSKLSKRIKHKSYLVQPIIFSVPKTRYKNA